MIITFAGEIGAGKDTVANILLTKILDMGFHYELLSIGDLRRIAASQKKMTIEQFNVWATKNPKEGDAYFEDFQREYAKKTSNFILVAVLGWFAVPNSYKIFLDVDAFEGAKRVFKQKNKDNNTRNEIICETVLEQKKVNEERRQSNITRYGNLYKVNPYEKKHFDLIIDTTSKTPEDVVTLVLDKIKDKL
jgi:cytidylate kinase